MALVLRRLLGAAAAALMCAPAPTAAADRVAPSAPPIVMIVFDEVPVVTLLAGQNRIDAARFPNFAALARDAIWFRNDTAAHDRTTYAVPAILTGRRPRRQARPDYCDHRRNLFTWLSAQGYQIHDEEPATSLWPPHRCGRRRWPHKRALHIIGGLDRQRMFTRWAHSIRPTRRPALWFQHTLLSHSPWIYYPDGRRFGHATHGEAALGAFGPTSPAGFHDPYLQRLAWVRHTLQLEDCDRVLGTLLRHLHRDGLYRRALVVVTADHGVTFHGGRDRRIITHASMPEIAPVPLFVKLPGDQPGRLEPRHVEAIDVLPTIADALGRRLGASPDGRSALGAIGAHRAAWVDVINRSFEHLHMRTTAFVRRERAGIRRQLTILGEAGGDRVYRAWPGRGLIGRPLPATRSPRTLRAHFDDRYLVSRAARRSFLPGLVVGTISGGRPGAHRTLALAVDGRVAAVAKSFHLDGKPGERFAFLAPEDALPRRGPVRLAVAAVSRSGSHPFTRLGRLNLR